MELNLKFNALKVDEIEQARNKTPIHDCIRDTSVSNLALFISKGLVDENGVWGVSRAVALDTIDKYLETHDTEDLIFDIMEALIKAGFLTRDVDIAKLREAKAKQKENFDQAIQNI